MTNEEKLKAIERNWANYELYELEPGNVSWLIHRVKVLTEALQEIIEASKLEKVCGDHRYKIADRALAAGDKLDEM